MPSIEQLNTQFRIPGIAEVIADRGGLLAVSVTGSVSGTVYLHGAHVTSWRPTGTEEVLFLSNKSAWEHGKPIRGGVPLCFPWFGPRANDPLPAQGKAPSAMHGFARLMEWSLESISQDAGGVAVVLALRSSDATREQWPHDFLLRHRITFGPALIMALEMTNTGTTPLTFEEAQHTYFSVADVRKVRVSGLDGTRYIDKTDNFKIKTQQGDILPTGETNWVYLDTTANLAIDDPIKKRRIHLDKQNSRSMVVWNPFETVAKTMSDLGENQWPTYICAETCNVGDASITLPPGQTHTMTTQVSVQPV